MGLKEAGWCEKIFLKLKRSNGYYSIIISIYKNCPRRQSSVATPQELCRKLKRRKKKF